MTEILMTLRKDLYEFNKRETLAQKIDKAWGIYINEQAAEADRKVALVFLMYAFDIEPIYYTNSSRELNTSSINKTLIALMLERNKFKQINPDYIPRLTPSSINLSPEQMLLDATDNKGNIQDPYLKTLYERGEIVDINNDSKKKDQQFRTVFFNNEERAKYRVHIYQGKFYRGTELFDTSSSVSHGKKEHAAFTLNANGELSVFPHHFGRPNTPLHSSMNSGCPVISAGELIIKNGNLELINTYSGHYKPSLLNTYRTLEYFVEKGINIENVKIHTDLIPEDNDIQLESTQVTIPLIYPNEHKDYYEISATGLLNRIKSMLKQALSTINLELEQYRSSFKTYVYAFTDALIGSDLTMQRRVYAKDFECLAETVDQKLDNNLLDPAIFNELLTQLNDLKAKNNQLSLKNGKKTNSGRLNQLIDNYIEKIETIDYDHTDMHFFMKNTF